MNDRFIFRAWHPAKKEMFDVIEVDFRNEKVGLGYLANRSWGYRSYPLSAVILMQSTALRDKAGKLIFEGDVVRADLNSPHEPGIMTVAFGGPYGYAAFGITGKRRPGTHGSDPTWDTLNESYARECEIIGNIYSNPELLKG